MAFSELHDHPVGGRTQLELLTAMAAQPRPVALPQKGNSAGLEAADVGEADVVLKVWLPTK